MSIDRQIGHAEKDLIDAEADLWWYLQHEPENKKKEKELNELISDLKQLIKDLESKDDQAESLVVEVLTEVDVDDGATLSPTTPKAKSEEKREVQIGKDISRIAWGLTSPNIGIHDEAKRELAAIYKLAQELVKMHQSPAMP